MVFQDTTENIVEEVQLEDSEDATSEFPPKKSKVVETTAPVWKFATTVDNEKAKCNVCHKDYKTPKEILLTYEITYLWSILKLRKE